MTQSQRYEQLQDLSHEMVKRIAVVHDLEADLLRVYSDDGFKNDTVLQAYDTAKTLATDLVLAVIAIGKDIESLSKCFVKDGKL